MRVGIAHKFIFGFILIIAAVVGTEFLVSMIDFPEWAKGVVPTLAAVIVGLSLGYLYSNRLSKNVAHLLKATESMAEGDLTHKIEISERSVTDEFDDLGYAINRMRGSLHGVISQIFTAANELAVSTETLSASTQEMKVSGEQIRSSMEDVAKGVGHQKESVNEVAILIHSLGAGLETINAACQEAAVRAREAMRKSEEGGQTARRTFEDLEDAVAQLEGGVRAFVAFSESIQEIHRFAEIISNISRQTNLLALNAAIEATKAGEEGKGFAVVADEIRRLADNSERSAEQISAMLGKLGEENRRVRGMVETSVARVTEGRRKLKDAEESLREINAIVDKNADGMSRIPSLVESQVKSSRDVERLVMRIGEVAEANAAAAFEVTATVQHQTAAMHEIAGGAVKISNVAEDLHRRVVRFRLGETV